MNTDVRPRKSAKALRILRDWCLVLALTLLLLVGADRLVGCVSSEKVRKRGLLFPPNKTMTYKTSEFSFVSEINSMGFRGGEPSPAGAHRFRIAAIGDSFTYGWGVDLEHAWPKILEANLREAGYDVEVLVLGRPAMSPRVYPSVVHSALKRLKPDVVLLGVLQGDDLAGCWPNAFKRPPSLSPRDKEPPAFAVLVKELFPNLTKMVEQTPSYKRATGRQRLLLNNELSANYSQETKQAIIRGDIIPAVVVAGQLSPEVFRYPWVLEGVESEQARSLFRDCLERVRVKCEGKDVALLALSIPHPAYTSKEVQALLKELGFTITPEMFRSNVPDSVHREIAQEAKVDFVTFTDEFLEACPKEDYYFRWDMHFNEKGYRTFANLATLSVIDLLERLAHDEIERSNGTG